MRVDLGAGFDGVAEAGQPIPAGRYTIKITSCEVEPNKAGDGNHVAWQGTVESGDHEGRLLFWNNGLTEKSKPFLKQVLNAACIPYDDTGFSTDEALGMRLDVQVAVREFEEKERNEVRNFFTASAPV